MRRNAITLSPSASAYRAGTDADVCDQLRFWSRHGPGANFAMGGGSVRWVAHPAGNLLPALATCAGGEPTPEP